MLYRNGKFDIDCWKNRRGAPRRTAPMTQYASAAEPDRCPRYRVMADSKPIWCSNGMAPLLQGEARRNMESAQLMYMQRSAEALTVQLVQRREPWHLFELELLLRI